MKTRISSSQFNIRKVRIIGVKDCWAHGHTQRNDTICRKSGNQEFRVLKQSGVCVHIKSAEAMYLCYFHTCGCSERGNYIGNTLALK